MDSQFIVVWNGVTTRFGVIAHLFEDDEYGHVSLASEEDIQIYLSKNK